MIRSKRGFTLLEVLIVLIIFSITSMIAMNGLHTFLHIQERLEKQFNRLSEIQHAMLLLSKDFQQTQGGPIKVNDNKILLSNVIYFLKKGNLFRINFHAIKKQPPLLLISKIKNIKWQYLNQDNQLPRAIKLSVVLEDLGVLNAIFLI